MIRIFNTLARKVETFHPVSRKMVNIFTCGPSVYQKAHIGNFRTFLFEDILIRYLEYSGYTVRRGMNFTDIEDKAIREAVKKKTTVNRLTGENIRHFLHEMKLLRMKIPDYLPKASESVDEAVEIIEKLISLKCAYWHKGNVYYDPLTFRGFGKLFGLDMSKWPAKKKRFHKDTYPGIQWNLGDFILWHGYKKGDRYYWDTKIGKGRPSWNVQDQSMIIRYFHETLSIYCGGVDNLFRHHDYILAILESVNPYPASKYWLHCNHLYVNGQKMSKSKGNILYSDDLQKLGYTMPEIRFFLVYGQYRDRLNYSEKLMRVTADTLRAFKGTVKAIEKISHTKIRSSSPKLSKGLKESPIKTSFIRSMDNDLNVKESFDGLLIKLSGVMIDELKPSEASEIIKDLREIDQVLQVIF
jgi:cysteinyl-tRNA synthetase